MPGERLTALILGGALTLHDDKRRALEMFSPQLIIACNHAARDEDGPVDAWASMHPDLFPMWIKERRRCGRPPAGSYWHARHRISPIPSTAIESRGGSSGLLCVMVALELGVTHAVLAGIPMVDTANHYDNPRKRWADARNYLPAWKRNLPVMKDRIRSMSGYTMGLLGAPDEAWFNGC